MMSPRDWMQRNFEKNRSFFERGSTYATIDWSKRPLIGPLCLGAVGYVITCYAAGQTEVAASWLADARSLIGECEKHLADDGYQDSIGLDRAELRIADRVAKLLSREILDRTSVTPYDAFEAYLSSPTDIEPEDFDCVWLMWGLSATIEDQRDQYEQLLPKLRRKPLRELMHERELLKSIGVLFDRGGDEAFWDRYRGVLLRWLDPILQTESEAFLYREAIRYLLALNWMIFRQRSERRDDFLKVLYGNI